MSSFNEGLLVMTGLYKSIGSHLGTQNSKDRSSRVDLGVVLAPSSGQEAKRHNSIEYYCPQCPELANQFSQVTTHKLISGLIVNTPNGQQRQKEENSMAMLVKNYNVRLMSSQLHLGTSVRHIA